MAVSSRPAFLATRYPPETRGLTEAQTADNGLIGRGHPDASERRDLR
jgi:hypothetical protein